MMRRCPKCDELLWQRTFDGVSLEGCKSCGGTWFDARELDQILQDPNLLLTVENAFRRGEQLPMRPRATNLCPVCRKPLIAFRHPKIPTVALESCPKCHGVWADEGKLSEIRNALQPQPQPQPAPAEDLTVTKDLPIVRGYHLPEIRPTNGILDQLLRGLMFVQSAFTLLLENPRLIFPILLNIALGLGLFVLVGLVVWAISGFATGTALSNWIERNFALVLVPLVFWYLATVILGYLLMGATVSMIDAYLKGRPVSLSVGFRDALKNADGLLSLALINIVIGWLTSLAESRSRDSVTGALGSLIRTLAEVATYLTLPIIIVEDLSLIPAFKRGIEIYRRHLLPIAVGEVGVRFISNILMSVATFVAAGIVFLSVSLGTLSDWLGVLGLIGGVSVGALLVAIVFAINSFIATAYHTCLYLWAVEYERAATPEQAVVPAPLAAALA
jgi:Zn-finger nucleic acid-binding protein